jgi:hypothetical protein
MVSAYQVPGVGITAGDETMGRVCESKFLQTSCAPYSLRNVDMKEI